MHAVGPQQAGPAHGVAPAIEEVLGGEGDVLLRGADPPGEFDERLGAVLAAALVVGDDDFSVCGPRTYGERSKPCVGNSTKESIFSRCTNALP